jgi:long-chain acyl-CoA synthetase
MRGDGGRRMRRRRVARVVFVGTLALAASASALDVAGVRIDEHAQVGNQDLVLNGAGLRKKLIFDVYVGSLYLPNKAATAADVLAQSPRRIQLNVMRKLSADQLIGALDEGLKENTSADEFAALVVPRGELAAIMKSFGQAKEGSVVTLDFVDGATEIRLDGESRGRVDGATVNAVLTRIWIGEHPVQADLRKAMLGGA